LEPLSYQNSSVRADFCQILAPSHLNHLLRQSIGITGLGEFGV
jgi:hypothetical protein